MLNRNEQCACLLVYSREWFANDHVWDLAPQLRITMEARVQSLDLSQDTTNRWKLIFYLQIEIRSFLVMAERSFRIEPNEQKWS